jgi:hypothetical protein
LWRSNRHENLKNHWKKHQGHPDGGDLPKQKYFIYDANLLAGMVIRRELSFEEAKRSAVDEVERRAGELQKDGWSENLWGRKRKEEDFEHD